MENDKHGVVRMLRATTQDPNWHRAAKRWRRGRRINKQMWQILRRFR